LYENLLAIPARPDDLAAVGRMRIAAAGRAGLALLMAADLVRLQEPLSDGNEVAWLGLVSTAADWAAGLDDPDLIRTCKEAFRRLKHLELQHAEVFDRVEETKRIVNDVLAARARGFPEPMLDVVGLDWCAAGEAFVDETLRAADAVLDWAGAWPIAMDQYLQNRGPSVPYLFARALDRALAILDPAEADFSQDLIRGLARQLDGRRRDDYGELRRDLFHLLLEHAVDPLEFAEALSRDPDFRFRGSVGPAVSQDVVLRVMWLCARLTGRSKKAK
jgi:hypothetical protein